MPIEMVSIDGVKIRMAKSWLGKKERPSYFYPHFRIVLLRIPLFGKSSNRIQPFCIRPSRFGGSESKSEYMSFEYQGDFLAMFIKHFSIEQSHIVGPDVGMPSTLSYIINHKHQIKSIMIGDGPAALPTSEPSIMKKMVHSGFWRSMFVVAGSGALIESAKNLGNVKYVPNKYEISDYKASYSGKVAKCMSWL